MDAFITLKHYQERLKSLNYADATIELYSRGIERFRNYLASRDITDLRIVTKALMSDYKEYVMAGTGSMESKALMIRPVKRFFEHLTETNQLFINPAEGMIEICRKEKKMAPTLTREEVQILFYQPNMRRKGGIRDRAVLEVLYATAIRRNELLSVEIRDVAFDEGVIVVRNGKGRKERVVPLGLNAARFLKGYLEHVRPHYCRNNPTEQRLFLNCKGKPLSNCSLNANVYHYRKMAGINKSASPHTLRRSCATHMMLAGADIRYIQELLGHRSLATTQQYCRVIPVDIKKTHEETHPNGRDQSDPWIS